MFTEALHCHEFAYKIEDIYKLVDSLLSEVKDPLFISKENYYKNYILPPDASTASEVILNEIINQTK